MYVYQVDRCRMDAYRVCDDVQLARTELWVPGSHCVAGLLYAILASSSVYRLRVAREIALASLAGGGYGHLPVLGTRAGLNSSGLCWTTINAYYLSYSPTEHL